MAAFTIEDIELIRRKSGISYQEAVALLDYHNGNVARALVDLERNGRLKEEAEPARANSRPASSSTSKSSSNSTSTSLLDKLFRARFKVHRGETTILNISALFALLSLMISGHLVIIGLIICIALGYKFSFDKHDHAFDGENLQRTVRNAAENVKASVNDFTKGFQADNTGKTGEHAEKAAADRSYYSSKRTEATYRPNYPTMNIPVQVESQDGNVTIESDSEGYSSATIE